MENISQRVVVINTKAWKLLRQVDSGQNTHQNWLLQNVDTGDIVFGKFLRHGSGKVLYFVTLSVYSHYGRHRELHPEFFHEIVRLQETCPSSLVRLIERADDVCLDGGRYYALLMEARNGALFSQFLIENKHQPDVASQACAVLGGAVAELHNNCIAHGDPHTDNVLIDNTQGGYKISFVDLCMLHYPEFRACQKFQCFQDVAWGSAHRRFEEDLRNTLRVGHGFITDLQDCEEATGLHGMLASAFLDAYRLKLNW